MQKQYIADFNNTIGPQMLFLVLVSGTLPTFLPATYKSTFIRETKDAQK